jgi:hypothetical protein
MPESDGWLHRRMAQGFCLIATRRSRIGGPERDRFIAGEDIGQRVDDHRARLDLLNLRQKSSPNGGSPDEATLVWRGHDGVPVSKRCQVEVRQAVQLDAIQCAGVDQAAVQFFAILTWPQTSRSFITTTSDRYENRAKGRLSGRPFCCARCDGGHRATRAW